MSMYRIGNGYNVTPVGNDDPINQRPGFAIFAVKTPAFSGNVTFLKWDGGSGDGYHGQRLFYIQDGMFTYAEDRGDNYGDPVGNQSLISGLNWNASGLLDQWVWVWTYWYPNFFGFRVGDSVGYANFHDPFASNNQLTWLGGGFNEAPDSLKIAQLHFFTAFTDDNWAAVRAGTLDPASLPGHIDGFPLINGLSSVKGVLTLNGNNWAGTGLAFDANDNPLTGVSSGGGTAPGPSVRSRSGGFGW
jgi:hypothetical protein